MKSYVLALSVLIPAFGASVGDLERAKAIGNSAAPVRVEVFSDFQCPACKQFHERLLPVLVKDYVNTGKVYIVQHEFPLAMHPYSREAAHAASAAARIGKYQQVSDILFKNQQSWSADGKVWETVASVLNPTDLKKVQTLAKDPAIAAEVQQDVQLGNAARVNQTPTIVVSRGAKKYPFAGPDFTNYPLLKSLIDGLLK